MRSMFELSGMVGHHIRRLNQISLSLFLRNVRAAGYDLTPVQFSSMQMTEENPGIDQAQLASLVGFDRVTIGGVIDRLEQKNYIVRQTSERDRRARELYITPEGARVLDALRPTVAAMQPDIISGLTQAEQKRFLDLLIKATEAGNELSRAPIRPPK